MTGQHDRQWNVLSGYFKPCTCIVNWRKYIYTPSPWALGISLRVFLLVFLSLQINFDVKICVEHPVVKTGTVYV